MCEVVKITLNTLILIINLLQKYPYCDITAKDNLLCYFNNIIALNTHIVSTHV